MRISAILLTLLFAPNLARLTAQVSPQVASLPAGEIVGGVYSNNALGVRVHVPAGWSSSTDTSSTPSLDSRADGLANRCTRILLREDAPKTAEGFQSWGIFFVIDAKCLSLGRFPKAIKEKDEVARVGQALIDAFKFSEFVPSSGVDISASPPEAKGLSITMSLAGSGFLAGPLGEASGTHLNTLFSVTEHNGLWLGWANVSDDPGEERLKQEGKVDIRAN